MASVRQGFRRAGKMDPVVRENKIEWVRGLIRSTENREPEGCPFCSGEHIVKYGRTGKGSFRFRCRECGKTFSTSGIISRSRLSEAQWMAFAECYVDGASLERTASCCDISKTIVRRMREVVDGLKDSALSEPAPYCDESMLLCVLKSPMQSFS